MDMEVDDGGADKAANNAVFVCCVMKKGGLKKALVPVDFGNLSLVTLKSAVLGELEGWEWGDAKEKPKNIDILHRSRLLQTDEDLKNIGKLSVVTVIKKEVEEACAKVDHKSEKFIAEYAKSRNIHDQLTQVALALRTAFYNPKFATMVEGLGDSEMLENIFAIAPELKTDPVGIGIIQDASLIFHLSDPESLKKLANTRPWVIEAFNFIAASIHQEKGSSQPQGIPSHLFNPELFGGEDESMEEGDDDESGNNPGPSRGASGSRITREQLSAALSALGGGGAGLGAAARSLGGGGLPGSNAFGGLFQPPQRPQATAAPNPGVAAAGANIQNLMNTLAGAGGGVPGQPLSSDLVARAVTDALRRLTPEQRADQLSAIRNFASQLQQQQSGQPNVPTATPTQPAPQVTPPPQNSSSASQEYQSQLRQMREMGITTNERLCILALRVSEGDVNTAVELILSGWTGEGSDPMD